MSKHTPGPWEYVAGDGNACGGISSKTGWICDFVDDPTPANARLIAAAPELLTALEPFVLANSSEEFVTLVVRSNDIKNARAAIAKATGGEV